MRVEPLLMLCVVGVLGATASRAQEPEWGAPLLDGLGGPIGYGMPTDGVSARPIDAAAPQGFVYYGLDVDSVYVNWGGSLTFVFSYEGAQPLPRERHAIRPNPLIAAFESWPALTDFRRGEDDPTPAYLALQPADGEHAGRIIATWHRVPDRPAGPPFRDQQYNDWQLVLTLTDDPARYTLEMRYSRCEWYHGLSRPDWLPVIGFDAGLGRDGPGWMWPGSLTRDARLRCGLSNVREPGVFRYEVIDGIPTGCGPDAEPPPGPDRCADGNHLPGDGCSPACYVEPDVDADGIYETPHPDAVDPLGVYDDCADPKDPLCFDDPDGDGIPSAIDNCDDDINVDQLDYDGDGFGDKCDSDDDNDGLPDPPDEFEDTCPLLYNEGVRQIDPNPDLPASVQPLDTDGDGLGDPCDPDDDDDGVSDCGRDGICRATDNGYNEDRDWAIDEADECDVVDDILGLCGRPDRGDRDLFDNDGDGRVDEADERPYPRQIYLGPDDGEDNCRSVPNPDQRDHDGDGRGDACDPDLDGDGIDDCLDGICGPDFDRRDNDGDGAIDEAGECAEGCPPATDLLDNDGDGFVDESFEAAGPVPTVLRDNCPWIPNPDQRDRNSDGQGDACSDDDDDGLLGYLDNCDIEPNRDQRDTDRDGMGDACDDDDDDDGVPDTDDTCPTVADADQADADGDGVGDACDNDDDDDGVPDGADNCAVVFNRDQADLDGDGIGDACDTDVDGDDIDDGMGDGTDNCPRMPNAGQEDSDGDGIGDDCDPDDDGDGIDDTDDVCPLTRDATQVDLDGDGIGDACDDTDDRPFAIRSPEEKCALLVARGAPTIERLRHCPPPADAGCSAAPATEPASGWWLLLLAGLRRRRIRR